MYRRKRERSSHGSTHGRNIMKRSFCLKAEVVVAIFDSHVRSRHVLGAVVVAEEQTRDFLARGGWALSGWVQRL